MKSLCRWTFLAISSLQFGCIANVAGSWDGEVDCGENGSVEVMSEIESRDSYFQGIYEGSAVIYGLQMNDVDTEIEMDLKLSQSDARGAQVLSVKAECEMMQSGQTPLEMDCAGFDELGWDGQDTLSGTIGDFLELFDCEIELRR